jgi:hypothetical protein
MNGLVKKSDPVWTKAILCHFRCFVSPGHSLYPINIRTKRGKTGCCSSNAPGLETEARLNGDSESINIKTNFKIKKRFNEWC